MISSSMELQAYSQGRGPFRGPTQALASFISDAKVLSAICQGMEGDGYQEILQRLGIDPAARAGAKP
jgi:hypothetical protein